MNSAAHVVLIAKREFLTRVQTRSFYLSILVTLVLIGAVVFGPRIFGGLGGTDTVGMVGSSQQLRPALTQAAEQRNLDLEFTDASSRTGAEDQLDQDEISAAVVPSSHGVELLVPRSADEQLRAVLTSAVKQRATSNALEQRGVDPAELAQATSAATVTVTALEPRDANSLQKLIIGMIVAGLLYIQLVTFGIGIATGVVEEKSSRVVELLLATVRPWQLLLGKVLGIGLAGLLQLGLVGALGLVAATAAGVIDIPAAAAGTLLSGVLWYVLGFTFFAMCYAGAGALISRQEDVQSTTTPMTMVLVATFFLAIFGVDYASASMSSFATTLAPIPPFSAILMPMVTGSGSAGPLVFVLAVALMLLAIALVTWLAGRIYRNSVLRFGARVPLREALRIGGKA